MKNKEVELSKEKRKIVDNDLIRQVIWANKKFNIGDILSEDEILSNRKMWFEINPYGYNVYEVINKVSFKVYYFKVLKSKLKYKLINICDCLPKPKKWNCQVNTIKEFVEKFCASKRIETGIKWLTYFSKISVQENLDRDYLILTDIINSHHSTSEIKKLIELGLIAKRTDYYNEDLHISRTYWYNPKIIELSLKLQKMFGQIIPITNSVESINNYLYANLHELFNVLNNYLLTSDKIFYMFRLRTSDKYRDKLTGRPNNKYSNIPSIENHNNIDITKTRQGKLLEYYGYEDDLKSLEENYWHYDVVSSIPRIIYALNHEEWLDESIDIYELIANELKLPFNKLLRETLKRKVLITNFSNFVYDKSINDAVIKIIGKNKWKSEIFIIEGYIYLMVYAKLILKQKYKLNWVFDAFEFYGKHPSKTYMKKLIEESFYDFLHMQKTRDISKIEELINQIKSLEDYEELDYNDLSSDNIKKINTLELISFHEPREIDIKLMKNNLFNYIEKHKKTIKLDNKYFNKTDKYYKKEDKYSNKIDKYSLKFQKICDKIEKLLKNKDFIRKSELDISDKTYKNLIKRDEFLQKFKVYRGKISKKIE